MLVGAVLGLRVFFFFNDTATTEIYTLSLHDALPICRNDRRHAQALLSRRRQNSPAAVQRRHAADHRARSFSGDSGEGDWSVEKVLTIRCRRGRPRPCGVEAVPIILG